MGPTVSRRSFLGSVVGGGLALSALNRRMLANQPPPSDQMVLGLIGVGGMGTNRLRNFIEHPDVRIASICDVDRAHVDRAIAEVEKVRGYKPQGFGDFRRVVTDPAIQAVTVVTPDHWHALASVRAMEAGKDVFVEKPLAYNIAEGRMMADASLKYKRVTQMGNHIHNDHANYRRVVELVQSGKLGKIARVNVWKTGGGAGGGGRAGGPGRPPRPMTVPATLDYDTWLGPAPNRPYHPLRSHGSFRRWWDYSGGTFIDFWAHIFDVVNWAMDLPAPTAVTSVGGRFFANDETETPDSVEAVLEYPNLLVTFSLRPTALPGFEHLGHIGALFQGSEAWLATNYTDNEVWVKGKKVDDFPRPAPTIPDSPGHVREFIDAVKTRNLETTCNMRYGYRITKPGLLSNISYRTGRRLRWNDQAERFVDDKDANKLLSRKFRKDYKL